MPGIGGTGKGNFEMEKKYFQKPSVYVGEVNIRVTDLQKSIRFYRDIFGFKILSESERKVVFSANGKTPLLTLEQPEGVAPKAGRTAGLYHFAILLPTREDLSSFLQHLIKQQGYNIRLGASDHYVSEALYFDDPDGNGIEVAHDRHSSEWNWNGDTVEMATVPLDAEGLLKETDKQWEGVPEDTLMGHIHLHVSDLQETENFYVNGLGFNIVTRYPGALFASTNGYHHHLGLNVWNGVGAPKAPKISAGLNWFSLVFPDEATLQTAAEKLTNLGAKVTVENGVHIVEDPAGNTIHLRVEQR